MLKFAEAFPDSQIVSALMRQLSWTHLLSLIYIADPLKRDFYAEMCRVERWSTRTLQQKIGGMLYEKGRRFTTSDLGLVSEVVVSCAGLSRTGLSETV